MAGNRSEQEPEQRGRPRSEREASNTIRFKFDRLPVRLEGDGPRGLHVSIEVTQDLQFIPKVETFVPSKEQRAAINRFKRAVTRRLIAETRLERTRESEFPGGDTISSESALSPIISEARTAEDFLTLALKLKEMDVPGWRQREAARESRLSVPFPGDKGGELPDDVMIALDQIEDEISVLNGEMTQEEFIKKWGVEFNIPNQ